jgi:hypothetical protein
MTSFDGQLINERSIPGDRVRNVMTGLNYRVQIQFNYEQSGYVRHVVF